MAVFFFIAHEKGFKFHAQPQPQLKNILVAAIFEAALGK